MLNCLFVLVLFQNYVKIIMLGLDAVLVQAHHFRHNAPKAAITLVIPCYLYIFVLLIIYLLVVTAVLMGWVKFGVLNTFWLLYY